MEGLTIYNKTLESELNWMFEGIYENVEECINSIDIRIIRNILMRKTEEFMWIEVEGDGFKLLNSILGAIADIDMPNITEAMSVESVKEYESRLNKDNPEIKFNVAKAGHIRLQIEDREKQKKFRTFVVEEVVADIAESRNE